MESASSRRQRRQSTSSISIGSSQQVLGVSDYSRAASDGYPYGPSYSSSSYRPQASSHSAPFPSQVSRSSTTRSSGSFRAAARGVSGVFGSCFVPRGVRREESDEEEEEASHGSRSAAFSQGSRSGGFSQGSRSGGFHVSTDSAGTGKASPPSAVLLAMSATHWRARTLL